MKKLVLTMMICFLAASMLMAAGQQGGEEKQVELSYTTWMTKGEDKPWMDAYMAANPNIVIKDEMLEGSKYPELMKTRVLSGDVPDVMMIMQDQVLDYGREGYLADLSDTAAVKNLQSQVPSLMNFTEKDGKIVALNITGGRMGHQWYNKKLFDDLGLEIPETIAEFEAVCEALLAAGKDPILYGGSDTWPYKLAERWGISDQVKVGHDTTGKYDINEALYNGAKPSDVYRYTFELFEKWVKAGYIVKASNTTSWPESSQLFADGNVGIFPQGPWVAGLPEVQAADPEKFELGVFLIPAPEYQGKVWLFQTMDRFLAVSASSENPEAAMDLFNAITADDSLIEYFEGQSLSTLLPLQYELPQISLDWVVLSTASNMDSPPNAFPAAPGFNVPAALKNVAAGQSAEDALAELDALYADNKEQIKF